MIYQDIGNTFFFHYNSLKYLSLFLFFFLSLIIFLFLQFRGKNFLVWSCFFLGLSQIFHLITNSVYHSSTAYYHFFILSFILIGAVFLSNFILYYFNLIHNKYLLLTFIGLQISVLCIYLDFYNSRILDSSIFFDFNSQDWVFYFSAFSLKNSQYLYGFLGSIFACNILFLFFSKGKNWLRISFLSLTGFLAFLSLPSLEIFTEEILDFDFLPYFSLIVFLTIFLFLLDNFSLSYKIFNLNRMKTYLVFLILICTCFLIFSKNIYKEIEKNFYKIQFSNLFNPYSKILIEEQQAYRFQYSKEKKSFYMYISDGLDFNFNYLKIGLINSLIYHRIQLLENKNFYVGVHDLVAQSPRSFLGYEAAIVNFLTNTSEYSDNNPKKKLLERLEEVNSRVIQTKKSLDLFFHNSEGSFYCKNIFRYLKSEQSNQVFIRSILNEMKNGECILNEKVYSPLSFHRSLLNYFQPIYDPSSKVYRSASDNLSNYIGFVYYNPIEDEIGEAGIDYTLYRKHMHETFIVQLLSLFAIIIIAFVFIPIFVKRNQLKDNVQSDDQVLFQDLKLDYQKQEMNHKLKSDKSEMDLKVEDIFQETQNLAYESDKLKLKMEQFHFDNYKSSYLFSDSLKLKNTNFVFFAIFNANGTKQIENSMAVSSFYSVFLSYFLSLKEQENIDFDLKNQMSKLFKQLENFSGSFRTDVNISYSIFILNEETLDSWILNVGEGIQNLIYKNNRAYDLKKQIKEQNLYYNKLSDTNTLFFMLSDSLKNKYLDSIEKVYGNIDTLKSDNELNNIPIAKLVLSLKEPELNHKISLDDSLNYDNMHLNGNGTYKNKNLSVGNEVTATLLRTQKQTLNEKKIDFLLSSLNLRGKDYETATDTLKVYFNSEEDKTKDEYWFYDALENKNINQYQRSIESSLKFESLRNEHIPNLLLLMDIYYIEGDFAKCLEYIEKILNIDSGHKFALRLRDIVQARNDSFD